MYGWIFDGISSLFEPATGQANNGELTSDLRRESHGRPVKRSYESVDAAEGVGQCDQVAAKRRRRDVVINFVKKTVAGVANLLRFRKPLMSSPNEHRGYTETQSDTLGIDELRMPWLTSPDWRMDKTGIGMIDRAPPKAFQGSLLPLTRKFSGTAVSSEKKTSLQLLPSRPPLNVGLPNGDQNSCNGFGHTRFSKPSLTVEEAIKQNDKERYRRLVEMVTEKYSKSQPLPFSQTKPQAALLSHGEHTVTRKPFESAPRKMPYSPHPSVVSWRNGSVNKSRWGSLPLSNPYTGMQDGSQHVNCAKKTVAELDLSAEVATRLNLVDRVTTAVGPAGAHTQPSHVRHAEDDVPRLTKEMAADVFRALAQSDPYLVLSAAFKLRITQRDLATLQEGGWLNDEVINFYFCLVMDQCSDWAGGARVYSFSTFFYPKLCGSPGGRAGGHAAVKRWTKAVDIFLYDLVLVPLHLGVHWALAVIDLKAKTVKLYDSMGKRHDDICNLLLLYLREEHRAKKGRELDSTKWTVGCMRPTEIPQQKNGSDCGVFVCKYAQYIAKGRPLNFRQGHMPLFRKLMIWEILHQKLL
ncbi:sentrin-specific protease 2 isoform X2 [Syngnathoides biaculeatus]|uniref:sentrin-specific protease 2 isoform X2 n=1 Tax=Syngnathoides biaculeatus TaxID=300417 RepID=UPI002ADE6B29|nr:sentrin-specific protease 2 isoform X2 [Syngnathoides biaculeatus]